MKYETMDKLLRILCAIGLILLGSGILWGCGVINTVIPMIIGTIILVITMGFAGFVEGKNK